MVSLYHISFGVRCSAKNLFTCTFCINAVICPRSPVTQWQACMKATRHQQRGCPLGLEEGRVTRDLCIFACPGLGSVCPALSKAAGASCVLGHVLLLEVA